MTQHLPIALTVAGSDSGGGAGIQADLKTFAALETHGTSAITAITAQSTVEVRAIHPVPPAIVRAQIDTVIEDFGVRVMKSGMLFSAEIMCVVAEAIDRYALAAVVDPVMISETGASLIDPRAIETMVRELLPRALLLTPNIPEAEALLGRKIDTLEDRIEAAKALPARAVLVKGGHARGAPIDVLRDEDGSIHTLESPRIDTTSTHGTGCTYAAAIAAFLARNEPLAVAVARAHAYLRRAIEAAPRKPELGRGRGPVHHFHPWYGWPKSRLDPDL